MQCDEIIWQCVNQSFCSFKCKTQGQTFCRNPMNVSGLCNRSSCVLANSRYATIVEEKGKLYLMMKTIERAHMPAKLWEKVKLSNNKVEALEQITSQLQYWPKFLIKHCRMRLRRIMQVQSRIRQLRKVEDVQTDTVRRHVERGLEIREHKAEQASKTEEMIRQTLLERLKKDVYKIYNFPPQAYEQALDELQTSDQQQSQLEAAEENEEELERTGQLTDRGELVPPEEVWWI
ncbi:putative Protein MAK16 [Paratrimastix pyriformis]|uniref:Protein MAK16 homolog n=1 Tax=Paratrimastix pyriformis TaxID=342808 RepID=A0ABQ8URN0_9EUKA|nr:putative Protein MAK16 [Paratrimastix pyriformis]